MKLGIVSEHLREAWFAASKPAAFAASLHDQPREKRAVADRHPRVPRSTGSTWWLVMLIAAPLGAGLAWLLQAGLGALVLLRPGGLGALAYLLLAWSFAPAAWVSTSLWPAALFDAQATFISAVVVLPLVHVLWLAVALSALEVRRPFWTLLLYVSVTLVLPLALLAWVLAAFAAT
jgi:hypothetical protein